MWLIAVRDNDTGMVPVLRPLTPEEDAAGDTLFAEMREKFPPPRFDLQFGEAGSVAEFVQVYPKFKSRGGGDGTKQGSAQ